MSEEEKRCCEPQSIFFCEPHLPPDAPPPPPPGGGASTALSAASRRDYERAYADASRGPPTADELLRLADHGPAADHGADAAREMRYHDAVYFSTRLPTPAHHRHRARTRGLATRLAAATTAAGVSGGYGLGAIDAGDSVDAYLCGEGHVLHDLALAPQARARARGESGRRRRARERTFRRAL